MFFFNLSIPRKTQLSTEMDILVEANPILATMIRTLLDVQTKKASEEEINEFRKFLLNTEKKLDK